ncbi:MAG: hypothetical protein N3G21_02765 [Candidatus Hydrogenedentes bacterium]|nr:hypothetical protein [Candidatus Hydrogenedentota bacterium]
MSEVPGVQYPNLGIARVLNEYMIRVLSLRRNIIQQQGEMIIKLIQSATLPEYQGKNLDIKT